MTMCCSDARLTKIDVAMSDTALRGHNEARQTVGRGV